MILRKSDVAGKDAKDPSSSGMRMVHVIAWATVSGAGTSVMNVVPDSATMILAFTTRMEQRSVKIVMIVGEKDS